MQITGNSIDTGTGPREWFMGAACATWAPHVTDEG
jgi:hypothetical protein